MTVIVVMAIFGLVTGFSTVRAGHSLPISIVRDFRLKGLAAGTRGELHTLVIRKAQAAAALPRPRGRDRIELDALNRYRGS